MLECPKSVYFKVCEDCKKRKGCIIALDLFIKGYIYDEIDSCMFKEVDSDG